MAKTLNLAAVFKSDAEELLRSREEAIRIHGTNIRAAGNEVEQAVRNYLKRMLPPRYYVTSGHLIDQEGRVSRCFRHQLLLPHPYLVLTKPLRLDIQYQRGASVKIGWKYLDD